VVVPGGVVVSLGGGVDDIVPVSFGALAGAVAC
jgi:hypothetical protein